MKIYIAGPISNPPDKVLSNVQRAMRAAVELIHMGHVPFCPHLSHFLNEIADTIGQPIGYEQWMEQDFQWLALCDGLLLLPGYSPGAERERQAALAQGLAIFHDVEECRGA